MCIGACLLRARRPRAPLSLHCSFSPPSGACLARGFCLLTALDRVAPPSPRAREKTARPDSPPPRHCDGLPLGAHLPTATTTASRLEFSGQCEPESNENPHSNGNRAQWADIQLLLRPALDGLTHLAAPQVASLGRRHSRAPDPNGSAEFVCSLARSLACPSPGEGI